MSGTLISRSARGHHTQHLSIALLRYFERTDGSIVEALHDLITLVISAIVP
jgi:hypothetical protein